MCCGNANWTRALWQRQNLAFRKYKTFYWLQVRSAFQTALRIIGKITGTGLQHCSLKHCLIPELETIKHAGTANAGDYVAGTANGSTGGLSAATFTATTAYANTSVNETLVVIVLASGELGLIVDKLTCLGLLFLIVVHSSRLLQMNHRWGLIWQ